MQTEQLGKFGHHTDPAIDFEVEVTDLIGEAFEADNGMIERGPVVDRIRNAMLFRVGGVPSAMAAKDTLRELENRFCDLRHERLAAAAKIYSELNRQGPNTMTITDVEADYLAKLLKRE